MAPAVVGLVLSVRGRPLAGASAARGLGTAGLVIGIVAVTFAGLVVVGRSIAAIVGA